MFSKDKKKVDFVQEEEGRRRLTSFSKKKEKKVDFVQEEEEKD